MSRRFVSGIAYDLGDSRPIDILQGTDGVNAEAINILKKRGLSHFCDSTKTPTEMCVASARETMGSAGLTADEISSIVIASSNADWIHEIEDETALFDALHNAGFTRKRLIGLTLQACSASGDALRIASSLIAEQDENVLVIIFGRREKGRFGPAASTVYSDGAASCIVSARPGQLELRSSETFTNMRLGAMGRLGNLAQFEGGVKDLGAVTKLAYEKAGISPTDIRAIFSTNGSLVHLEIMANAAGVPKDRIYNEDVAQFAHIYSCDNLVSLRHYMKKYSPKTDDHFLLLAWSPHVVSATILRYHDVT